MINMDLTYYKNKYNLKKYLYPKNEKVGVKYSQMSNPNNMSYLPVELPSVIQSISNLPI